MKGEKSAFDLKGITGRWLINTFGLVSVLFLVVIIIAMGVTYTYYYGTVQRTINMRSDNSVRQYFTPYIEGSSEDFLEGAREFTNEFSHSSTMLAWIIDDGGHVVLSTSSFPTNVSVIGEPDYQQAKSNETGESLKVTHMASGEKVMAKTIMLRSSSDNTSYGAVRYIISLQSIDRQLIGIIGIIILASLVAILLVAVSGIYFVRSIVLPVHIINKTAKQIAGGDMDARIDISVKDDEIGELSATINNMAEELGQTEKVKNDFISTVSHELRTPLTSVVGWGETLLELGLQDPELMKKGLRVIVDESSRLSGLVDELLDFSKIESGRFILKKQEMDVIPILNEAIFIFKDRAVRENKGFMCDIVDTFAPIEGDSDKMRQVFTNILDNSFKYTKAGDTITIIAHEKENEFVVSISDTGCGIAPEDLPNITEKFYKANLTEKGSGIGLAVSQEIVVLHGGTLEMKSILGSGTTAIIRVPLQENLFLM